MMVTIEGLRDMKNANVRCDVEANHVSFEEVRGTVFVKIRMMDGDHKREAIVTREDLQRALEFLKIPVTP